MLTAILTKCHPATDKTISVQVYIFRFGLHIQGSCGQVVEASGIRVNDPGDVGSIPENVIFLNFQNFNSFQILARSGVYRHTFSLKFHRPHGLVGGWATNREVSGSIPSPKSAG